MIYVFYVHLVMRLYADVVSTPTCCVVTSETVLFNENVFHAINHGETTLHESI